jgi:hypothetical protein
VEVLPDTFWVVTKGWVLLSIHTYKYGRPMLRKRNKHFIMVNFKNDSMLDYTAKVGKKNIQTGN